MQYNKALVNNMSYFFKNKNNYIFKIFAFVIALMLMYQISFTSLALADEVHHHCKRDTLCHVCKTISIAKIYLSIVALSERVDNIFFVDFLLDLSKVAKINLLLVSDTPVSLKVKLLN